MLYFHFINLCFILWHFYSWNVAIKLFSVSWCIESSFQWTVFILFLLLMFSQKINANKNYRFLSYFRAQIIYIILESNLKRNGNLAKKNWLNHLFFVVVVNFPFCTMFVSPSVWQKRHICSSQNFSNWFLIKCIAFVSKNMRPFRGNTKKTTRKINKHNKTHPGTCAWQIQLVLFI